MKDWEESKAYLLSRILCLRSRCRTLPGKLPKPNMRLFSLNEHDEWTLWRSNSDYFYPEMIPEPDYTDSGEDAGSEDDEYISSSRHSRPVAERLRDVTEVYVANADVKIKKAALPKMPSGKQASSSKKQVPKNHAVEKVERQPRKMSPKTLPKAPRKIRSKSPTRVSKPASPTPKSAKLQEGAKKTAVKGKSPHSRVVATASTRRVNSPESAKKFPARSKSPTKATDSKSKPTTGKAKSPEGVKKVSTRTKSPTRSATPDKLKAKPLAPTTKKEAGDPSKTLPLNSPTTDESKSSMSSAVSTEHSSDDELIKPRKPYQFSTEKQKLHKELKFSQRYCKLTSPKTELQLAIERFTENKEKRGMETGEKTSLEKILDIQARKIKMVVTQDVILLQKRPRSAHPVPWYLEQETSDTSPPWVNHLQKPPATLPNPKTDEFYRVHARVVNNNTLTHCFLPEDDQSEYPSSQTVTHTESGSDS